tara:strand:- start:278 stop:724 length:447 start_codon:yes stop_codon:yes gene_type:complete
MLITSHQKNIQTTKIKKMKSLIAQDSPLNAEMEHHADQALKAGQKRDSKQKDVARLIQRRDDLNKRIASRQKEIDELRQLEHTNQKIAEREKYSRAETCKLIEKHALHYDLNDNCPYIESDQTIELEDQDIYIDSWSDALKRCDFLLR